MQPQLEALDRILELLRDTESLSVEEIRKLTYLPEAKLIPILRLFADFGFIELNEESEARIKPLGLRFLELPSEVFQRDLRTKRLQLFNLKILSTHKP